MQQETKQTVIDFTHDTHEQARVDDMADIGDAATEYPGYPDATTVDIASRNLTQLKEAAKKGKVILNEHYNVIRTFTLNDTLVLEAIWTGTLAIPLDNVAAGQEMKAYVEQHYQLSPGNALRRRGYDNFEPEYLSLVSGH